MNQASTATDKPAAAWRSPWVIGWLALILVVLSANATMVFFAIATNPGLVRNDYYESGRNVERTIVTRLQSGPGWTMKIDTPADVKAKQATTIRFFVVDKVGQPVTPEAVVYYAYRPSDARLDLSMPMEQEAPGRYVAKVLFPIGGLWDTLVAVQGTDGEYSANQRISVAL